VEISTLAELRPRHVWDIVDDAFDLYRERFALFGSISAALYVPAFLIVNLYTTALYSEMLKGARGAATADPTGLLSLYWDSLAVVGPTFGIAFLLQLGATSVAVDDILKGGNPTLKSTYARALRRFFPLVFSALIIGVLMFVGLCGVYVGALLVLAYHLFVPQAIMIEGKGAWGAGKRARDLAGNHFGKAAGMLFLLLLIGALLGIGLAVLVETVYGAIPRVGGDLFAREQQRFVLNTVSYSMIALLLAPLPGIATTLLYYDIRVRREGLDIESEAQRKGVALAPDPFGGVLNPKVPKANALRKARGGAQKGGT